MKHLTWTKALVVALASMALAFALSGCTLESSTDDTQAENTAYMSDVNQITEEVSEKLDSFIDAVSRGDLVTMRTQADSAFAVLDKLDALEVPEGLEDIQQNYVDGVGCLEEALNGYIDLYAEIESDDSFDWSTFADRLAEIQALYDEGIALLEAGDVAASEMS